MRVLISGGSRGIGAALVKGFSRAGHAVAFLYRENKAAAERVAAESGAVAIRCDVSDPHAVDAAVREAERVLGGHVEILVNNAGISHVGLSRDITDAEWRAVLDTNLSGAMYLSRAVQGGMISQKWGRIINIGSMWGKIGASMEVAYSAAKAGLRGFTMALAKELGPSGITVNCVEPGVIATDMNAHLAKGDLAVLCDETPLCRIGTPEDVFGAVAFFAGEAAAFVTGQCLGVDGGFAV